MKRIEILLAIALCILTFCNCEKNSAPNGNEQGNLPEPEMPEPEIPEEEVWTEGYPDGVIVESFEDDMGEGKICKGIYAIIDFSANSNLKFNVVKVTGKKTPTDIYSGLDRKTIAKCKNMFTLGMACYIYNLITSWQSTGQATRNRNVQYTRYVPLSECMRTAGSMYNGYIV